MPSLAGMEDYVDMVYNEEGYNLAYELREERKNILEKYKNALNDIIETAKDLEGKDLSFIDNGQVFNIVDKLDEGYAYQPVDDDTLKTIIEKLKKKYIEVDRDFKEAKKDFENTVQ
jgi:hypothetical protein